MPHPTIAARSLSWSKVALSILCDPANDLEKGASIMPVLAYSSQKDDLVLRLRRLLSAVDLDCDCRATLHGALDRFTALEYRRQMRRALAEARENKDQIIARLAFLAEIDELTEHEPDRTVFAEVAALFDEISVAAGEAAKAIRSVASLTPMKR
jgi:hypothetical protein